MDSQCMLMIWIRLPVMRLLSARAEDGEKFTTLDGQERQMDEVCTDDL